MKIHFLITKKTYHKLVMIRKKKLKYLFFSVHAKNYYKFLGEQITEGINLNYNLTDI